MPTAVSTTVATTMATTMEFETRCNRVNPLLALLGRRRGVEAAMASKQSWRPNLQQWRSFYSFCRSVYVDDVATRCSIIFVRATRVKPVLLIPPLPWNDEALTPHSAFGYPKFMSILQTVNVFDAHQSR